MVLSTRVSLQWLPNEPEELTSTMVFTSTKDHFVDVRIYKERYPYKQTGTEPENFEDVFQWVIVGEEEEIKNTNKIRFNHSINSQEITTSLATGKPLSECRGDADVGSFWPMEGTEDRKETGSMAHPDTGVLTDYVEIWRSLNPNVTSPDNEVREGHDEAGQLIPNTVTPVMTFDLNAEGFIGRIIRLGDWVQGVIYEETEKQFPISVMRSFRDAHTGAWTELITYGKHAFPEAYRHATAQMESEYGKWHRVE
ncbi:hypothetical protein JCM33374_g5269 [Metschnikowia sp. JCM 33374]|nr:hypothetical protein JCM33374_g5269 [Metschnikowia sp. JCM 33374]